MGINRTVRPAGAVSPAAGTGRAPNGAAMTDLRGVRGWTPTVANLLVLVVLEIVAFAAIRYVFHRVSS
jgi:hypothetical protein